MKQQTKTTIVPSSKIEGSNRSQTVFITVGLAIVVGGLWLLYDLDGPYHPEIPVTDTFEHDTADS
ncbi:MAG: hypothetical protein ACSHWS_03515 [Sulfitobacter sp.]